MKTSMTITCLLLILTSNLHATTFELRDLLEKVQMQNLDVLIEEENSLKLKGQKREFSSSLYPSVSMEASFVEVEKRYSNNSDRTLENVKLVAQQSLFRGFGEYRELSRLNHQQKSQEQKISSLKRQVTHSLLELIAQFWWYKARLARQKELYELSTARERLLTSRVSVGKSRKSDLLNAKSQTSQVLSQMAPMEQELSAARQSLQKYLQLSELDDVRLPEILQLSSLSASQQEQDQKNLNLHPSLLALDEQIEALNQQAKVNRAYHWPQLDLKLNYYTKRSDASYAGPDWDIGLYVTVPLFEGNVVSARNQQVFAQRNQAELQKKQQRDELLFKTKVQSEAISYAKQAFEDAQKSTSLQKASYESVKNDYQYGLANNLEVNQSLNQYIQSLLLSDQAKINWIKSYYQYHTLSGRIP